MDENHEPDVIAEATPEGLNQVAELQRLAGLPLADAWTRNPSVPEDTARDAWGRVKAKLIDPKKAWEI
jgi:hypothetical protein